MSLIAQSVDCSWNAVIEFQRWHKYLVCKYKYEYKYSDCKYKYKYKYFKSFRVQVRVQVQVLDCKYKYKYTGLPLAMQMKLNRIHESWLSYYRSHTHINTVTLTYHS